MKKLVLFLFLSVVAFAQVPTITVSSQVVQDSQTATFTCTANCTGLTWQVNGVTGGNSTVGTISGSGSTATYTAPASIVANNVVNGCPAGANDAIWNVPIDGTPELANWNGQSLLNSDWLIKYAMFANPVGTPGAALKGTIGGGAGVSDAFHIGFANNSSPLVTVAGIASIPWPQTPSRGRETGIYTWNNTDQHVELVNTDTCDLWDEYQDNNTTYTSGCTGGQTCYHASSAGHEGPATWTWSGGVDAAGNNVLPYLVHLSEVLGTNGTNGVIKHALHFNGPQGADGWANNLMWPANWGTGFASGEDIVGFTINNGGSGYDANTTITVSGGLDTYNATGTCVTVPAAESQWTPVITGGVITGATYKHLGWGCKDNSGNLHLYIGTPPAFTVTVSDPGGSGSGASLTAQYGYIGLPYGGRYGLDKTWLAGHSGSCTLGSPCYAPGPALTVLTGLANYGMFLLDNQGGGNSWLINFADDIQEDPAARTAINNALSQLNFANFHIYDNTQLGESTLQNLHNATGCNDDFAGQPCHVSHVVANNNLNYIPPGAAWVTATNSSGSSLATSMYLQAATIGTPDAEIYMLTGDYTGSKGTSGGYQIPYWVRGTTNTAVTWTCPSCVGTITSGGIYTPPLTYSTIGTKDIALCTLQSDPNVQIAVYINLLPDSGNYVPNVIRVDTGTSSNITDGNGHSWLGGIGFRGNGYELYNNSWNNYVAPSGSGSEKTVYNTSQLLQSDFLYKFIVPNGDYKVRLMCGWDEETWGPAGISVTTWQEMPYMIWSNDNGYTGQAGGSGGIKGLFWNMLEHAAKPFAQDANSDFIFGDKVVDNTLMLGLGGANPGPNNGFTSCTSVNGVNGGLCFPIPELSGVDIEQDNTAPYWAIAATNALSQSAGPFITDRPSVVPGGSIGLYVQDNYTGLTNQTTGYTDAVWSLIGPGALTPITMSLTPGLSYQLEEYTAPSSATKTDALAVVKACSASSPSTCASLNIRIAGNNTGASSNPITVK